MKVKLNDLKLAIEQVPVGTEVVELEAMHRVGVDVLELAFGHTTGRTTRITVYDSSLGVTPEVTQTVKLYRKGV